MWNQTDNPKELKYTKIQGYEVAVNQGPTGLEIYLKGYGVAIANPGCGAPLYLDLSPECKQAPAFYIWADITEEEPTQVVPLHKACEDICLECGEHRPDDARVQAGMKCGYCAYGG